MTGQTLIVGTNGPLSEREGVRLANTIKAAVPDLNDVLVLSNVASLAVLGSPASGIESTISTVTIDDPNTLAAAIAKALRKQRSASAGQPLR